MKAEDAAGRIAGILWDAEARQWAQKPDADFNADPLFQLMRSRGVLNSEASVLDVGCGSGRYSVVFASHAASVVGCDASKEMIEAARSRARSRGCTNARFEAATWREFSSRERFDVVVAHRTAAISTLEDIDKMARLCRGRCFYTVFLERTNPVVQAASLAAGLTAKPDYAEHAAGVVAHLMKKGLCPQLSYEKIENVRRLAAKEAVSWCLNRIKLRVHPRTLASSALAAAENAVCGFARGGQVEMSQRALLVTIDWSAAGVI